MSDRGDTEAASVAPPGVPHFGVLGPLEVRLGGEVVAPPPGDRLRLLAGLVAAWGRPVLRDDLVELVWDEAPPPSATNSLKAQMSRVRNYLVGLHPELGVDSIAGGYALVTGAAVLDRDVFDRGLQTARRAVAAEDHQRVVHAADQCLALWRGPAFGALADHPVLRPHAVHLDEERSVLVELRAAALLQLGHLDQLVSDLGREVSRSPLREELRRLLMVALARTGRGVEAVRTYQAYRQMLAEEIGMEPSPGLSELQWRILDNDPLLLSGAGSPDRRRGGWALPPELTVTSPVSVGRDGPRHVLGSALAGVADGGRAVVVVRGEAGAGKSHLVATAAREAHDAGALVLAGACDGEVRAPLGPFVRALRFFREQTGTAGDEVLAPWWPELSRLLPEVPREEPVVDSGLDPQSERARLFDALAGWLAGAAADLAPVVLVLEDLHWADEMTLLALKHLGGSAGLRRVLVAVTVRDPEPQAPALLEEVIGGVRREGVLPADITLEGLSVAEVAQLVGDTRADLSAHGGRLADIVVERTNGNPLFVQELLSEIPVGAFDERGAEIEAVLGRIGSPPSARHLVTGRLRHLDPVATRVLTDAALIGDEIPFDLLTDVSGLDPDGVLRALDGSIDMGLLVHLPDAGGRLRFAHAVVRDALVARLGHADRIDGHRRIAAGILRLPDHRRDALVEELARHASEATLVDGPAVAVPPVVRAGRQALDRRAYAHAAQWFARALDLAEAAGASAGPGPSGPAGLPTRFELLCALGSAQRQAADPDFRDAILGAAELARDADDAEGVAEAALLGTRGFFRQTAVPDHEWIGLLDGVVDTRPDGGRTSDAARARLLASLASELVWADPEERRFALSDEAVALARATGSATLLSQVLVLRLVTVWAPDTAEDRLAAAAEAIELTGRTGDNTLACHASRFGAAAAIEVGDRALATERFAACERLTDAVAQPDLAWHLTLAQAGWTLLGGDLDGAATMARAALRAGHRAAEPEAISFYGALDLEIRRLRGDLAEVIDLMVDVLDEVPFDPAYGLLRHLAAGGRPDLVADDLAAAVADLPALGRGVHTLAALANLADLAHRLGERGAAEALYPRLAPFADHFPQAIVVQPVVHHFLGLLAVDLGRPADAEAHFDRAVGRARAFGAPLHEAETLLAWGRLLDRPEARAEGRRLADAGGALGLLTSARA